MLNESNELSDVFMGRRRGAPSLKPALSRVEGADRVLKGLLTVTHRHG